MKTTIKLDKVLLVEDDETTIFLTKLVLDNKEIKNIDITMNGLEALLYIEKNCPDLIILDISMPIMDGFEFLDRRDKNNLCPNSQIVILTSSIRPEDKKKAFSYNNVIDYMEKPLTSEKVDVILQKL